MKGNLGRKKWKKEVARVREGRRDRVKMGKTTEKTYKVWKSHKQTSIFKHVICFKT